jgi:hypothetical protein
VSSVRRSSTPLTPTRRRGGAIPRSRKCDCPEPARSPGSGGRQTTRTDRLTSLKWSTTDYC